MNEQLEVRNEYLKFFGLLLFFGALMIGAALLRPIMLEPLPAAPTPTVTPAGLIMQSFFPSPTPMQQMVALTALPTPQASPSPTLLPTPIPTPTPIPSPTQPALERYRVQPGDTLFRISQRFGVTVDQLVTANKLANRNLIRAGQELIIPGTTQELVEPQPDKPPSEQPNPKLYVIQPGDTLWRIAQNHGVDMEALATVNYLRDTSKIYAGQVLIIP